MISPRNPFRRKSSIGIYIEPGYGSGTSGSESADEVELNELETKRHLENSQKLTAHLMTKCGQHITNLTISSVISYKTQRDFIQLIDTSLRHCPNTKQLKIVGGVPKNSGETIQVVNRQWPENRFLTRLEIEDGNDHDATSTVISLVQQLSYQLKELRVQRWDPGYAQTDWWVLRKLQVHWVDNVKTIESLTELNAEYLRCLKLSLAGIDHGGLKSLLNLVNHFRNLEDLELSFAGTYKILEEEVDAYHPRDKANCPISIKRLTINTGLYDSITYSLVAYFPYLEYLYISYGEEERLDKGVEVEGTRWAEVRVDQGCVQDLHQVAKGTKELVNIRKYLYKNSDKICKSNVWKILPFLKKITIGSCFQLKPHSCHRENAVVANVACDDKP